MGSEEMGAALDAIERIGIINVALFVIIIALAFERVWNARNNKDASKPLTDAISALTAAVVSGDKRAEDNTRAWQRVVEANTTALERAAESKDKIGDKVDALAAQEVAHFGVTSVKLDANAAGVKTTETTLLAALETGAKTLGVIEAKLTEIHGALKNFGTLETRLSGISADIGEVLHAVKTLHQDVDARSTKELPAEAPIAAVAAVEGEKVIAADGAG